MLRYLFRSLNILNCLLALAVSAALNVAVIPLLDPVPRVSLPPVQETTLPSAELKTPPRSFPAADYAVVSDKNLFHPERKIPSEKQPEKTVPKPDVYLHGTLITEDGSIAFIEDRKAPYSTPGRGKRQTVLKKGDVLSGYTLGEIAANRIVFFKGEDRVVVMLDDRAKKRAEPPAAPASLRSSAAGMPPVQPMAASPSPAAPASAPVAGAPTAAVAVPPPRSSPQPAFSASSPPTPRSTPSLGQETPSRPGIGASGVWPPTQETVGQTQQKILEGRKMRMEQIKQAQ
ncbi:MAG: hypothetical protein ACYC7J_05690 [Syntrophales bacterium]